MKREKVVAKLKMLIEKADLLEGGEKAAAEEAIRRIAAEYKIPPEELFSMINENKKYAQKFTFRGKYERKLLLQIIFFVTNDEETEIRVPNSGPGKRTTLLVKTSETEGEEITKTFSILRKKLADEFDRTLSALIDRHRLYPDFAVKSSSEATLAEIAEFERISRQARLMDRERSITGRDNRLSAPRPRQLQEG